MKEKLYLMKGNFFLVKIVITLSVLPVSDILSSWEVRSLVNIVAFHEFYLSLN